MSVNTVLQVMPLGFPWVTFDPFLFCVHHDDAYPAGNEALGPAASLAGRAMGMDFEGKDGWRMYHGDVVPGFPRHPHRGFETVTVARRGFIDHSDSLGATARYGKGDVQWLTAGRGIVHAEMFPLLDPSQPNPLELFQIWLNLPAKDKMVAPYFSMLWSHAIPRARLTDHAGRTTEILVIAGRLGDHVPPSPPPNSWASDPSHEVAIWSATMTANAQWTLPLASAGANRTLYFFRGQKLSVDGQPLARGYAARLRADLPTVLVAGPEGAEFLVLQGIPVSEPVVQHGPFVMNRPVEIQQAILDYRRTEYGGWPWQTDAPVHPRGEGRFAIHADGRTERG